MGNAKYETTSLYEYLKEIEENKKEDKKETLKLSLNKYVEFKKNVENDTNLLELLLS